jgi:excisionase family DNA binding protein
MYHTVCYPGGMRTADATADSGLTSVQRREVAHAIARRYLSSLAAEQDLADMSADGLRERLRKCRELLASVVESSRPSEPLARTVHQAAAALGVNPMTVYRLINNGDLPAYRIWGRSIRVDEAALRSYLAGHVVGRGEITGDDVPDRHIRPAWR